MSQRGQTPLWHWLRPRVWPLRRRRVRQPQDDPHRL